VSDFDLNPDGPHSPERTAEAGQLFDDVSRLLCYATMSGKGGLKYPADAYRLLADLYTVTSRLPQTCAQMAAFLRRLERDRRLESDDGEPVAPQVAAAAVCLGEAATLADGLTAELQAAQNAVAHLRGKVITDG
jgi:hypothetical protein